MNNIIFLQMAPHIQVIKDQLICRQLWPQQIKLHLVQWLNAGLPSISAHFCKPHVCLVLIVVTWMKPRYFLSSSCTCWSAFVLMVLSLIKYGTICNSPTHHQYSSQHAFFHMQSASYITLITFMYSSTYLSLYFWITPLYFKFNTPHTHDYLPALGAWYGLRVRVSTQWGWLPTCTGCTRPCRRMRVMTLSAIILTCTCEWWWKKDSSICKRNTQLNQTSWGSCVADTDIIHVTILNIKTNKINTTSSQPAKEN